FKKGVNLLQTTSTAKEKAKGLKKHAFMQASAYIFAIVGFSFIVYNKAMMHKEHFTSNHGKFGLTVFCYLFFQLLFGLTIAYIPRLYGNVTKAKQLWKFHRMTGYILLVLIWITAQLGVRADYMYKNLWSPKLIIGHYIALALVVIGIAGRVRLSKWGLSSSTSPPAALPQQAEVSRN
ncbi:eukaryotic cytochrome b561-domain-containing protein, partial [Zychaea mexicana]|uniref:eukaryotic cytochrome b561-domain-containing protein n=1 Tax=Zychaea mexicana TaxID=64656 RepID=UPI0022FF22E2